jgi:hypothetical protein
LLGEIVFRVAGERWTEVTMADDSAGTLPAAVTKAYDLLLWLIEHVGKFPRSHRFVLCDRIEACG